jgi:hypothetical protein
VPLAAAAVCPHPPLIVPEIAGAAAADLDDLRAACDKAVARLLAADPVTVIIVGSGEGHRAFGPGVQDTFARYGVPVPVRLGGPRPTGGPRTLPLSLLAGGWLLARAAAPSVVGRAIPDSLSVADCLTEGADVARAREPVALLVMGDGTACRGEQAPGYDDPRAQPYDDRVAAALAGADADALLGLDPGLSAELKVAGRAPWQVLAGAARAAGGAWRGDLTYYAAPYGVAYFVATWKRV